MFTSLTVISFFFVFAGLQQIFLNRLIKSDLEALQQSRPPFRPEVPPKAMPSPDSHAS